MRHPLNSVVWLDPATLQANDYNPNRVASPEMALLKESILANGWTQPVVVRRPDEHDEVGDGIQWIIVDGFHRTTLARTDVDIQLVSDGKVPAVIITADPVERRLATVRHNRARGAHGILRMGAIVEQLRETGLDDAEICRRMGMHQEEVDRLTDARTAADVHAADGFSEGWVSKRR